MSIEGDLVYGLALMGRMNDVIKDTHGNLSMRVKNTVAIKPSGVPYDLINSEDIYICDVTGKHGGGPLKPSVDLLHHLSIYQRHDWIGAICHTHSPYATAFALANRDIDCISTEQADYFGGPIYCMGYRDLNSWGLDINLDKTQKAVLLGNHGCLTFADDPVTAVKLAVALENVAQKTFLAKQIWNGSRSLYEDEIEKWHKRYNGGGYGQ